MGSCPKRPCGEPPSLQMNWPPSRHDTCTAASAGCPLTYAPSFMIIWPTAGLDQGHEDDPRSLGLDGGVGEDYRHVALGALRSIGLPPDTYRVICTRAAVNRARPWKAKAIPGSRGGAAAGWCDITTRRCAGGSPMATSGWSQPRLRRRCPAARHILRRTLPDVRDRRVGRAGLGRG